MEGFKSFRCAFIDSCVFKHLAEDFADFLLQDMPDVLGVDIRIGGKELVYPVSVFRDLLIAADVFSFKNIFLQELHLTL